VSILFLDVFFFTVPNSIPESARDGRTTRRSRDTPNRIGQARRAWFLLPQGEGGRRPDEGENDLMFSCESHRLIAELAAC